VHDPPVPRKVSLDGVGAFGVLGPGDGHDEITMSFSLDLGMAFAGREEVDSERSGMDCRTGSERRIGWTPTCS
jgi:hypothetical protein